MSKRITFAQLKAALDRVGFQSRVAGTHMIFQHPKGAILTVPANEAVVRPIVVSNAVRQVANTGIATASSFEAGLLRGA